MKRHSGLELSLATLCFSLAIAPAFAADMAVDAKAIKQTLSSAPALELAPAAAKLVKDAPAKDLEATTREVVRASVNLNPSASVAVVGTIASEKTAMAPVAAGTAAALAPNRAVAIARAAAASAPTQAGKIVQAVCEAAPKQYKAIVLAVSKVAPGANKEILLGLARALPNLKEKLAQLEAGKDVTSTAALETILQQIGNPVVVASASTPEAPNRLDTLPTTGGPFQPLPVETVHEIPTSYNNPEGPGGRPPPAP